MNLEAMTIGHLRILIKKIINAIRNFCLFCPYREDRECKGYERGGCELKWIFKDTNKSSPTKKEKNHV